MILNCCDIDFHDDRQTGHDDDKQNDDDDDDSGVSQIRSGGHCEINPDSRHTWTPTT